MVYIFFTNKTVFFPEDLPAMDQGLSLEVFGLEVQWAMAGSVHAAPLVDFTIPNLWIFAEELEMVNYG